MLRPRRPHRLRPFRFVLEVPWLPGIALVLAVAIFTAATAADDPRPSGHIGADRARIAAGEYLVRAGNCLGCHTARGGVPFAGGRPIVTPFGTLYTPNLTPDPETGLGRWSEADFLSALTEGVSKNGQLLYPAFPYPNYARLTREDGAAMYAYFMSLPPTASPRRPHTLRFPYDAQLSLAAWRARYFRPAPFAPDPSRTPGWNRGAYLVHALGHCDACHSPRSAFGAIEPGSEFAGGLLPDGRWYAPSLRSPAEGSVATWPTADIVRYLKTGWTARATASGPMAEVVFRSTQYLSDADLLGMAEYLVALPADAPVPAVTAPAPAPNQAAGAKLYEHHCADCHGRDGKGAPGAYPALAGNRSVTQPVPVNLIRMILEGGYSPATAGNPRPFGMPPFAHVLRDPEIAVLATYLRSTWGHRAVPVSAEDVGRLRGMATE